MKVKPIPISYMRMDLERDSDLLNQLINERLIALPKGQTKYTVEVYRNFQNEVWREVERRFVEAGWKFKKYTTPAIDIPADHIYVELLIED